MLHLARSRLIKSVDEVEGRAAVSCARAKGNLWHTFPSLQAFRPDFTESGQ